MEHLKSIYRSYDIRGEYPNEITENEVYKIGCALVQFLKFKTVAIGRDIRPSGDTLFDALKQGVLDQGGNVVDLGLVTSPMCYFALNLEVDGVAMITASHLPSNFNGIKIYRKGYIPVHQKELKEIEGYIKETTFQKQASPGLITSADIKARWHTHFKERFDFANSGLTVVVDPANMIGVLEIETLKQFEPDIKVESIYGEFDYTCPNHEANPVKFETLRDLSKKVVEIGADLGIAFDGDADRVGLVDEKGTPVPADVVGAIIANYLMETGRGKDVVATPTCTKSLSELVEKKGGRPYMSPVGRTNVSEVMRNTGAEFGVELSGHFFFKELGSVEGGVLPALYVLSEMKRTGKKLSELVNEIVMYYKSDELNSEITLSIVEIYARLQAKYPEGKVDTLDGLRIDFEDWWFNVRPSANDPVMRLNLEADTKELLESKTKELLEIIRAQN